MGIVAHQIALHKFTSTSIVHTAGNCARANNNNNNITNNIMLVNITICRDVVCVFYTYSLLLARSVAGEGYTHGINDLLDFPAACPTACPRMLDPVCVFDGYKEFRYFNNKCLLLVHQCQTRTNWFIIPITYCQRKWEEERNERCTMACTYEYAPVCGYNSGRYRLFNNECIFLMENCYTNGKWQRAYIEDC